MPNAAARPLSLSPRQRKLVSDLVKSGRYRSEKAAVDAAMKLLEDEERDFAECVEGIRRGMEDVKAGRVRSAEDVFADLERKYFDLRRGARRRG
jgi:antitoxin ParD1/3/4